MRRKRNSSPDNSGHDSFLDIVANLVGILVILIMVVGVRARNAFRSTTAAPVLSTATDITERPAPLHELEDDVQAEQTKLEDLQRDTFQLEARVKQLLHQSQQQMAERDELQLLVSAAETDLAQRRTALSEADQVRNAMHQEVLAAQHELEQIQSKAVALASAAPDPPKILPHYPTPLAEMVFGREEHFRLLNGRLVYVPINAIVDRLRDDAEKTLWKLKQSNEITQTIGPLGGFRVRYTMQRRERRVRTEFGPSLKRTIELARFTLFPLSDTMGKPLAEALAPQNELAQFLRTLDPTDTTITVWTYPDSFEEYRQLKGALQEMGFRSAARPMPHGHPIGGSPDGSRSAAE